MPDRTASSTPAARPVRVLVIGASGLVGGAFFAALRERGHDVAGTYGSRPRPGLVAFDFKQHLNLEPLVSGRELVILASALTHVDYCESHAEEARARNVDDVRRVGDACRAAGAALLSFSTDYVFDGAAGPYAEDAPVRPLSVYGRTKLAGEAEVAALPRGLVLRITNAFDIGYDDRNFVHRCVTHLRERKPLVVPSDQWATPCYATWLARQAVTLLERGAILAPDSPRLLHAGCDDLVSRGELARRVARQLGADPGIIEERPTAALAQAAPRPLLGGLRNDRWNRLLGVERLPLDDALADCLPRMKELYAGTH
jgi:dTDP-4-dehydrorhamnose reductase